MSQYMYGDKELNHTLININDSAPMGTSAYSGAKTEQLAEAKKQEAKNEAVSQAASAAEAAYVKKTDIQGSVNTSGNPPSSAAVKAAVDGVAASIAGTKVNAAFRADLAEKANAADSATLATRAFESRGNDFFYSAGSSTFRNTIPFLAEETVLDFGRYFYDWDNPTSGTKIRQLYVCGPVAEEGIYYIVPFMVQYITGKSGPSGFTYPTWWSGTIRKVPKDLVEKVALNQIYWSDAFKDSRSQTEANQVLMIKMKKNIQMTSETELSLQTVIELVDFRCLGLGNVDLSFPEESGDISRRYVPSIMLTKE